MKKFFLFMVAALIVGGCGSSGGSSSGAEDEVALPSVEGIYDFSGTYSSSSCGGPQNTFSFLGLTLVALQSDDNPADVAIYVMWMDIIPGKLEADGSFGVEDADVDPNVTIQYKGEFIADESGETRWHVGTITNTTEEVYGCDGGISVTIEFGGELQLMPEAPPEQG